MKMRTFVAFAGLLLACPSVFALDPGANPADMGAKVTQVKDAVANSPNTAGKVKGLIGKLSSTTPAMEQTAAKNQLLKLGKQAVPFMNDAVQNDKRTYTRIQLASILGTIKDPSSIGALAQAAKSQYPLLGKAAVKSLGEIGGPRAAQSLEQLKTQTKDRDVRQEIESALARIQGRRY